MSDKPSTLDLSQLTGYALAQIYLVALEPETSALDTLTITEAIDAESFSRGWPEDWWQDASVLTDAQVRECRAPESAAK